MTTHKMLLYPADPQCPAISTNTLVERLQSIGLIAAPIKLPTETIYPVGEHFLQLITFLGCSPTIELEPPADIDRLEAGSSNGSFCHVAITATEGRLQFRADDHKTEARCPQCRQPDSHWREHLQAWQDDPECLHWSCSRCGYTGQLTDLNFRKFAGFGRIFLEIRGIYPSEAIPGETLLASLEALNGCKWSILYIKE